MSAFAVTIFTGAFLLFQVQPLIGKFILPWFGGTPAVWTTCMLFFQILLLGGYAYSHWLTTWVSPRKQAAIHCLLLMAAVTCLPITPADSWKPGPDTDPVSHILLLLMATIGLPYFALSTTGPLLQKWFSWLYPDTSPYRLYSLSNVGSLLALVSYPFVIEPALSRRQQTALWSLGLFAFVAACGWCAWRLHRWGAGKDVPGHAMDLGEDEPRPVAGWRKNLLWLLLPASASALLLAVTNKLCQDVAVVPFLWVLPLSIYLLTFILCFDKHKWYWRRFFLPFYLLCLLAALWMLRNIDEVVILWQIAALIGLLFAGCMICHGELYRLKPDPRQLTRYYLFMSLGGALGGLFVAVVAPLVFVTYVETFWTLAVTTVLAWVACYPSASAASFRPVWRKAWLCGALVVLAVCIHLYQSGRVVGTNVITRARSFYGTLAVTEHLDDPEDFLTAHRALMHGRITHGLQALDEEMIDLPTTYYGDESGVGLALHFLPDNRSRHIAVVGLGAGTLATRARATDRLRFYEINPDVVAVAREQFTFLARCPAELEVVVGDARLSMEREPDQAFDLIALDAFSSDAIPAHLLTAEAFEVYARHLQPGGCLAIHISNRFLDLEPVVMNAAAKFGYHHVTVTDNNPAGDWWIYESTWMVLSKDPVIVEAIRSSMMTEEEAQPARNVPLWTDDYTSLFPILINES